MSVRSIAKRLPAGLAPAAPAAAAAVIAAAPAAAAPAAVPAAAAKAAGSLRTRPRFVDRQIAATERIVVQLVDRLLRVFVRGHLDERESACATRGHVAHHLDRVDRAGRGKELLQLRLPCRERQVADVEFPSHLDTTPVPRNGTAGPDRQGRVVYRCIAGRKARGFAAKRRAVVQPDAGKRNTGGLIGASRFTRREAREADRHALRGAREARRRPRSRPGAGAARPRT